ncbi:aminodeoxychorismate synthase component I [Sphingosinicella sp.]|uniref:aminodeoxychorismate synthase component I n=1 Tax=Sphingosinicella sp. TaxID=1917971 RepID=UPI002609D6DD|nr:aminodeoxychorismate synthase component I [Sphingosinicella sp.]
MLSAPFVALDDARGDGARPLTLYSGAHAIITAARRDEVRPALDALRRHVDAGRHVAGFLVYEAGHALEPRLFSIPERSAETPLVWFGVFDAPQMVPPETLLGAAFGRDARVSAPEPALDAARYAAALGTVKALIEAGDIYQANLTFPTRLAVEGHPLALYARLRRAQRMGHGALVFTGDAWILSFSPELFFTLAGGVLETRPMKGTAPRRPLAAEDAAMAAALAADPKNRAENLMITDLIRNDLARVAEAGSVTVRDAFAVERYPTVHQMTTTVDARLRQGLDAFDVLEALFPCGSITGAPKIRAMEVIDAVEARPRGVYTGAIGAISPGAAHFNVAIRTIEIRNQNATMGIGSGIVADSDAASEWRECGEKMAFVSASGRPFHLIETMGFTPDDGIAHLSLHLERLEQSAAWHDFRFDRHEVRNLLQAAVGALRTPARVKLVVAAGGGAAVSCTPPPAPSASARVVIVPLPVAPGDPRLAHKTSDRAFYDTARRASGMDEVIFERSDGRLTEGSFTNLFVERDGLLLTPPASDGLLPGVLRRHLLETGRAREASLTRADLEDGFLLGNALRGLFRAALVAPAGE